MSHRVSKSFAESSQEFELKSLSEIVQEAYSELHFMAQREFNNEQSGHTLQPTALVHETFIRLFRTGPKKYVNRAHFFSCAAKTMRRTLASRAATSTLSVPSIFTKFVPIGSCTDRGTEVRAAKWIT